MFSAVFVLEVGDLVGPMLAGWVEQGHRVAAIVTSRPASGRRFSLAARRRRKRQAQLLRRCLGGVATPVLPIGRMSDWDAIAPQLAASGADILVCFGFPKLIPDRVLALFANGGVNLHPTLLPFYRGPNPLQHLLVDDAHAEHGGMTLHRMSSGYDEGDLLGQIPLGAPFWQSGATYAAGARAAMRRLVVDIVPEVCAGRVTGQAQPKGDFPWAPVQSGPLAIDARWTSGKLRQIQSLFGHRLRLTVEVGGRMVPVAHRLMRLGPPSGKPPRRMPFLVSFDLADGRFLHLTMNCLTRQVRRWRRRWAARPEISGDALEVRRFGDKPPS